MSDDPSTVSAQVLSAIAKDVYSDVVHPSARRVGLALETLTKVVLSPVAIIDWGFEQSKDWLKAKVAERLAHIPPDCVVEPTASIAYSALSHIALSHETPELRDLYAELLLKALDSRSSGSVHPAYFHVVEQLAPAEALIIVGLHALGKEVLFREVFDPNGGSAGDSPFSTVEKQFESFSASVLSHTRGQPEVWLINLCRLGLLTLQTFGEAVYHNEVHDRRGHHPPSVDNREHRRLMFTEFGSAFVNAVTPQTETELSAAAETKITE